MDYFLVKQLGNVSFPGPSRSESSDPEEPSVRIMKDVSPLEKYDYLAAETLVSSRMKQHLEQYLPEQVWKSCVFVDLSRQTQAVFWFLPSQPYKSGIFHISNYKGNPSLIIHLSVAESLLRRGICGLNLVPFSPDFDTKRQLFPSAGYDIITK